MSAYMRLKCFISKAFYEVPTGAATKTLQRRCNNILLRWRVMCVHVCCARGKPNEINRSKKDSTVVVMWLCVRICRIIRFWCKNNNVSCTEMKRFGILLVFYLNVSPVVRLMLTGCFSKESLKQGCWKSGLQAKVIPGFVLAWQMFPAA